MMKTRRMVLMLLVLALAAIGCGDDSDNGSSATTTATGEATGLAGERAAGARVMSTRDAEEDVTTTTGDVDDGDIESGVVFEDDFSDPDSGWIEHDEDELSASYVDETWLMTLKEQGGAVSAAPVPAGDFADGMELEVAVTGGDVLGFAGIMLGEDADNCYLLEIVNAEGAAYMTKVVDGFESFDDDIFISGPDPEDSGVEPDEENLLSIAVEPTDDGSAMVTFFVNGEEIGQLEDDDPLAPEFAGLEVWAANSTPEGAEVEGTFDDFTLTALEAGTDPVDTTTSTTDNGESPPGAVEDGVFTGNDGGLTLQVQGGQVVLFSSSITVVCGTAGVRPDVVVVEEPIAIGADGSFSYDTDNVKVSGQIAGDSAQGLMSLNRGMIVDGQFCMATDVPWSAAR